MDETRRRAALAGVVCCGLSACGANGLSTGATTGGAPAASLFNISPVTGYQASNAMMPQGHAVSGTGDPDTVRITATGSPETPAARLEQIALARAGEYGAELRKKTFVAAPSSVTVKCGASTIDRRSNIPTLITNYRVLTMDVTYPNPATDPTARPTGPMAETMKAALASETIDAATQAAAAAEVKAACKRGA